VEAPLCYLWLHQQQPGPQEELQLIHPNNEIVCLWWSVLFAIRKYLIGDVGSTTSNTILMEDMRQKDIFTRSPDKYMAYIGGIETRCLEDYIREKNIDRCSERVATDLNLNIDLVNERVEDAARKCKNTLYD
jgi:hypothetical protein